MLNNNFTASHAALLSGFGTASAHDTGLANLPLGSNQLRRYTPAGTRRRHPSASGEIRAQLAAALTRRWPLIRKVKLTDTGILFTGRVKLATGRIAHARAYSLANLRNLLVEQLTAMEAEA